MTIVQTYETTLFFGGGLAFSPLDLGFLSFAIISDLTDTDGIEIKPPASESHLRADKRYKYFG